MTQEIPERLREAYRRGRRKSAAIRKARGDYQSETHREGSARGGRITGRMRKRRGDYQTEAHRKAGSRGGKKGSQTLKGSDWVGSDAQREAARRAARIGNQLRKERGGYQSAKFREAMRKSGLKMGPINIRRAHQTLRARGYYQSEEHRDAAKKGAEALATKYLGTREWRDWSSKGGRVATSLRVECANCGMVTTPAAMGRHLKASGHEKLEDIRQLSKNRDVRNQVRRT